MSNENDTAEIEHCSKDKIKPYGLSKFAVYSIALVIALSIMTTGFFFYKIRYGSNPSIKESGLLQAQKFYDLSIYFNPEINSANYYGSEGAGVTIIAFLDMHSDASRYFMKEIFPKIREEYIDSGNARYYHKSYISVDSINKQDIDFEYSIALECVKKISAEKYYDIYFDLFAGAGDIQETLIKRNISIDRYQDCIGEEDTLNELYKNAMETENLGIAGIGQRFYIGIAGGDNTVLDGVPSYAKFNRTIRQYEIQIGN